MFAMVLPVLLLAVVSLVICVPLLAWLIGAGRRWGHVDAPGSESHKSHTAPVPSTGGIAIFWAVTLPLVGLLAGAHLPESFFTGPFAPLAEHAPGLRSQTPLAIGLIIALAVMHTVGLIDDRRRLSARTKLGVQFTVAMLLVAVFDTGVLTVLRGWGPPGAAASFVVSVLWIVAIINAMNMLDNMDGLSAGVGAIIAAVYLAATLIGGQWFVAGLCALLLGALVGFLVFNFPPAKVFMGDGGSLVLGLLLAVISVRTTYVHAELDEAAHAVTPAPGWHGVLVPLVVMAIPLYDLVSVSVIRLRAGRNPMTGDQNHFSHRLVRRGLSRRSAVIVVWLATAATATGGAMLGTLEAWQALLVAVQAVMVLAMIVAMERGE